MFCCEYYGFSSFLSSSLVRLIFLKIYRPLPMYSVLTTGFYSIACSFPGGSLCYSFFRLLVSSVSGFCLDTKGTVVDTFFFLGSLVQSCCGEGGTMQTNNTGVCSQYLSLTGSAPAHGTCSLPAHTAQALGCSTGNHPWLALGCLHLPVPAQVQALG